jgi:hypothetical protein
MPRCAHLPPEVKQNPDRQEIAASVRSVRPGIIHLAGIDLHEGDYLSDYAGDNRDWDGMYVSDVDPAKQRVEADELADLLNPGGPSGAVVSFNFYYSASRIAPLAVMRGASIAIGFLDKADDALSEQFFATFYQRRSTNPSNTLNSFARAYADVGHTLGVVFWTRESLIRRPSRKASSRKFRAVEFKKDKSDLSDKLKVEVRPKTEMNYSLLHNGTGIFSKFRIYKTEYKFADDIEVHASLNMGSESFPYEATFDFGASDSVLDIASHVNLPLTSQFARSLRETVQTSLAVRVRYQNTDLYNRTHRVTLQPINEWKFDDEAKVRWLNSFVLSGDPVIPKIIDAAQKYLMALCDSNGQGFDGYQNAGGDRPNSPNSTSNSCGVDSVDSQNSDDSQSDENATILDDKNWIVDMQVRAIWCALSFDFSLNYINPPPSFVLNSQRLRTPSDVILGGRGTCIDLALLFAACLEYVEIYPVIFLFDDHAFPGYWRCESAYRSFLQMKKFPKSVVSSKTVSMDDDAQVDMAYEEVRQCVYDGLLTPLETTWLTLNRGFAEAVEAGMENLKFGSNFEALLNVKRLRDEGVIPLPVCANHDN